MALFERKCPYEGDTRIVRKFVIFPKTLLSPEYDRDITKALGVEFIKQRCCSGAHGLYWRDLCWAFYSDKRDEKYQTGLDEETTT